MKFGRTSNPAIKQRFRADFGTIAHGETMTLSGTINKTAILLLLTILTATFAWKLVFDGTAPLGLLVFGGIGGFIVAIITSFNPKYSPYLAPIYALLEGLALGALSAFAAAYVGDIVFKAIFLTFTIFLTMLFVYRTGLIKVTEKFKAGMTMAVGGVFFFYMLSWISSIFGINLPLLHDGGIISIIISLVIIVIASLMLLWDFSEIQNGIAAGAPQYMEWYSGFSLLLTVVWLYIEIINLLSYFGGD